MQDKCSSSCSVLQHSVLWHSQCIDKAQLHVADLRQDAVRALHSIQPCPALLQSASQLWKPQQYQSQLEQTPLPQSTPQQSPSQQDSAVQTLSQETRPQQALPLQQIPGSVRDHKPPVPPLPESKVSMLRQQARICSLYLTDIPEEEQQECHMRDEDSSDDDEEEKGQKHIQVPDDLKVNTFFCASDAFSTLTMLKICPYWLFMTISKCVCHSP